MIETLKKMEEISLDLKGLLNNELQRKILEDKFGNSLEGELKMVDWIKNNSARFRDEFNNLFEELKENPDYIDVFAMAEAGDNHILLENMYETLKEEFKETI